MSAHNEVVWNDEASVLVFDGSPCRRVRLALRQGKGEGRREPDHSCPGGK